MTSIEDMMREARLKWFEHVKKGSTNIPVWRYERLDMDVLIKSRGNRRRIGERQSPIRQNMMQLHLTKDMVLSRNMWRM